MARPYSSRALFTLALVAACVPLRAEEDFTDLIPLGLEELVKLKVTSVSKKVEDYTRTASAIHVITREDIRRSGMRSLPELLRLAPGVNVARMSANQWAISIRGFNSQFADKLLVLVDGRVVYTPFFSGVYWDLQDLVLEDIERIEIIRGPGGTLWGANAVNGVINVITRSAKDTHGGLVRGDVGLESSGVAARYGGKVGEDFHYRAFLKYTYWDDFVDRSGDDTADQWNHVHGGLRLDWDVAPSDLVTVVGNLFAGDRGQDFNEVLLVPPFSQRVHDTVDVGGGNLLGRWTHTMAEGSSTSLQAFYDHIQRNETVLEVDIDLLDVEFQHNFRFDFLVPHEVVWGLGYRSYWDRTRGSFQVSVDPDSIRTDLASVFIQDDLDLFEDRLHLIVGTKLEHNDFSGFEVQPSGRLHWSVTDDQTLWAAVSRAVRTPNRVDAALRANFSSFNTGPGTPTNVLGVIGDSGFDSEEVLAFEVGWRGQLFERLFVDIAGFYNEYDRLRVLEPIAPIFGEPSPPPFPPHNANLSRWVNEMRGKAYGVEIAPTVHVADFWKISGSYSFLRVELHSSVAGGTGEEAEESAPRSQFQIRSYLDLPYDLAFDAALYYVERITGDLVNVPSYFRLDLRLGWRPLKNLEVMIGAQNLLDSHHPEFGSLSTVPTEVERNVFGSLVWTF